MKKRILTVLLAVCLVFALGTVTALADGTTVTDESSLKSAVEEGGTVVLNNDITITSTLKITNTVKLDLNGHKLDNNANNKVHTVTVASGGNLTIVDSSENNEGVLDNVTHATGALVVESGGIATLNGGTLTRSQEKGSEPDNNGGNSWYVIQNSGTLTVNNGATVSGTSGYSSLICNKNIMYIYGGIITQEAFIAVKNEATLVVSGGTITSNEQSIQNWGKATISDGTLNGNVYTWGQEGACGHTDITGGTIDGDVYAVNYGTSTTDKPTVKVSNATVTGDVASEARNYATEDVEIEIDSSKVYGNIDVGGASTVTVTGSTVTGTVSDNTVVLSSTINGEYVADRVPDEVEAIIGGRHFETLEAAIAAASDDDVITLVDNADIEITAGTPLVINDGITIDGNGKHIIDIRLTDSTLASGRDKILQIDGAALVLEDVELNITGFNDSTKGYCGDAIDFPSSSAYLTISNSEVNINNVAAAFVLQDTPENIVINNSTVDITNVRGNASQGGNWKVTNSSLSIDGTGDLGHGLSVESIEITNSDVVVKDVGLYGLTGSYITLNAGAKVVIDNGGRNLPYHSEYAGVTYYYPVVVKSVAEDASLVVNSGASLSVINCVNKNTQESNNIIYIPDNADYTNSGTVYATVELDDNDTRHFVTLNMGYATSTSLVADKTTIRLDTLTRNGYIFGGWRVNGGSVVPGGTDYIITADTTFTAIWEAVAYDYDIVIDDDILHGDIWTSPKSEAEAGDTVHVYADPDAGYVLEDLSVTYRSGRYELKLTRVSANHYTFTMPAYDVYVTAEFASDGFPFDDVRSNQWFYDAVYYVWANDLMEGVDYDEFNPNGTMTRAMFWAVLGRIDGETITGSDWADEARDWAMSEGVSDGTDPNGLVTREQMVTMLWRYAGERDGSGNLSRYTDGDKVAQYATEAMRWALGNGIIEGITATTLEPQATATRAQCAAIFMRYYE